MRGSEKSLEWNCSVKGSFCPIFRAKPKSIASLHLHCCFSSPWASAADSLVPTSLCCLWSVLIASTSCCLWLTPSNRMSFITFRVKASPSAQSGPEDLRALVPPCCISRLCSSAASSLMAATLASHLQTSPVLPRISFMSDLLTAGTVPKVVTSAGLYGFGFYFSS